MASRTVFGSTERSNVGRQIGVVRLAAAAAVSGAAIFVLCWLGTLFAFASPTHGYITLFTPAPVDSVQALAEGSLWSLLFGALAGTVFALIYNLLARLDRR